MSHKPLPRITRVSPLPSVNSPGYGESNLKPFFPRGDDPDERTAAQWARDCARKKQLKYFEKKYGTINQ